MTAKPHTGCAKFTRRVGTQYRLRGICAKVVSAGTITTGDEITKLPGSQAPRLTIADDLGQVTVSPTMPTESSTATSSLWLWVKPSWRSICTVAFDR